MGKFERQGAHLLHRGSGGSMYTRKANATRETPTRDDTALRNAAAKPGLHRRDARQTTGRPGRTAQGDGDRGQGSADETTMVKAGRVVGDAISGQCVKTDPICETPRGLPLGVSRVE